MGRVFMAVSGNSQSLIWRRNGVLLGSVGQHTAHSLAHIVTTGAHSLGDGESQNGFSRLCLSSAKAVAQLG